MIAEIVSVGTELLLGQIVDTHAATMAKVLAECGLTCSRRSTVGDNLPRIVEVLRESLARADVVVTIGGLGPTMDDLTRDGIAAALGDRLERVPSMETELRDLFESRGFHMVESILRQADRPTSGQFIDNPNGTAPGLICRKDGKVVIALPGPKGEFDPMATGPVKQFLGRLSGEVIRSVLLRVLSMGESQVEEVVKELMSSSNPTVAPYANLGEVHLRVTSRAPTMPEADQMNAGVVARIQELLGSRVLPVDSENLEAAVLDLLKRLDSTVAVAESMTGGELAARLSSPPGAGEVFVGGAIVYTPKVKTELADVPPGLIDGHGPVSPETASELATGIRERLGATYGLSVTGNAGPTSDVDGKPVGLVYVGLADPRGVEVREQRYGGGRADVRRRTTQFALTWLRERLLVDEASADSHHAG